MSRTEGLADGAPQEGCNHPTTVAYSNPPICAVCGDVLDGRREGGGDDHDDLRQIDGHESWRGCFHAMHAAGGQSHD